MKSLKNTNSINQISKDYLLGITKQPEITCPIINALQFSGNNRSKIYKCELGEDPNYLEVDTRQLIKTIEKLKSWATDICNIYHDNNLIIEIESDKKDIEGLIKLVEEYVDHNYISEIEEHQKDINKIIDRWNDCNSKYEKEKEHIEELELNLRNLESSLDNYDSENEDDEVHIDSIKDEMSDIERDIDRAGRDLDDIEREFRFDVELDFDKAVIDFTEFLESVRTNNDNTRSYAYELRGMITSFIQDEYDLRQPMEYLKTLETGKNNEISLGILDIHTITQVINYLASNEVISSIQKDILKKSLNKQELIGLLQNIGYEKIRYYESENAFLNNKELYKEIDLLKIENKKENKLKIN